MCVTQPDDEPRTDIMHAGLLVRTKNHPQNGHRRIFEFNPHLGWFAMRYVLRERAANQVGSAEERQAAGYRGDGEPIFGSMRHVTTC
jgi:hypothetical protein